MIKIGITGPESSGKTELAEALSLKLNAGLVKEYARTFLEQNDGKYNYEDLDFIAKKQLSAIHSCDDSKAIWIIDTEMLVMKIWSEYKYQRCESFILDNLTLQNIDLYILCKPDFPWQEDPFREHPEERDALFTCYENSLIEYKLPYIIALGSLKERVEMVVEYLENKGLNF